MTAPDPYLLPEGNVHIAFSGGRSSAFMLRRILDANGPLPNRAVVTFQNTGREMPQTLDFVREVGERWNVPIIWLEYTRRDGKVDFDIVDYDHASRNGEPFDVLINSKKMLPNVVARFCTIEMKIRTAKRYLMSLGWKHWANCVGIRADEPRRHRPEGVKFKDRWTVWQPMAKAGATKRDVSLYWNLESPFDLDLPNENGKCWLGNCDGCFLKSEANIALLTKIHPGRAAWWERAELRVSKMKNSAGRPKQNAQFSKRYGRADLRRQIEADARVFSVEGYFCQADDGECTVLDVDGGVFE